MKSIPPLHLYCAGDRCCSYSGGQFTCSPLLSLFLNPNNVSIIPVFSFAIDYFLVFAEWQTGTLIKREGDFHCLFQHDNVFEDEEGTRLLRETTSLWFCRPTYNHIIDSTWVPAAGDLVNARLPDEGEDEDGIWWPCEVVNVSEPKEVKQMPTRLTLFSFLLSNVRQSVAYV